MSDDNQLPRKLCEICGRNTFVDTEGKPMCPRCEVKLLESNIALYGREINRLRREFQNLATNLGNGLLCGVSEPTKHVLLSWVGGVLQEGVTPPEERPSYGEPTPTVDAFDEPKCEICGDSGRIGNDIPCSRCNPEGK